VQVVRPARDAVAEGDSRVAGQVPVPHDAGRIEQHRSPKLFTQRNVLAVLGGLVVAAALEAGVLVDREPAEGALDLDGWERRVEGRPPVRVQIQRGPVAV